MPGDERILGYCTNVHAGADWNQTKANLQQHAAAVRRIINPEGSLPIGLWLSQPALAELTGQQREGELAECCRSLGLEPFTFNGFPYGNFHQPVVKHAVYEPAWDQPLRAAYTIALAKLHATLADGPCERSISTLPLGWGDPTRAVVKLDEAAFHLRQVAQTLNRLHDETGVLVHVDIEPEPGCIVERSDDVIALFEQLLRGADDEQHIRTHLRVCHDICHAAVMFEDQAEVLARYRAAGIKVGKVQVSSALRLSLRNMSDRERTDALAMLRPFAEDRYLHQTMIDHGDGRVFFEDLPQALNEFGRSDRAGDEWRVHYHVPIFWEGSGPLGTTQREIEQCLAAIEPDDDVRHFEVETYTWNVLPPSMRNESLAEGIAHELRWMHSLI